MRVYVWEWQWEWEREREGKWNNLVVYFNQLFGWSKYIFFCFQTFFLHFASFFFFSDEKLWKTFENKKNVWKLPKMYFNRLSGACCNQNFAKIHNTNDTRLWVLLQWSRKSYWLVSGCLDDGRVVSVMSLKFGGV